MPSITHICLSDVHLGANTAILTDTPAVTVKTSSGKTEQLAPAYSAAPLRQALAKALAATLGAYSAKNPGNTKANIVLLGDVLDFSLGNPKRAIDDLDLLLKALKDAKANGFLGQFIFVPGNHDHQLWTVARFDRMAGNDRQDDNFSHVTKAFDKPAAHPVAPVINTILKENGFTVPSATYYPNMGLQTRNATRAVVLHHGHFVESAYKVMSNLVAQLADKNPDEFDTETLEILNASWIDFLWSSDGDDGKLGHDIQIAYEYLLTGSEDLKFDHRLAKLIADRVSTALPLAKTASTRNMVSAFARALVDATVGQYGQTDRFSYAQVLDSDSQLGLRSYIKGPVLKQIAAELPGKTVKDLTFIFGHTHKPFEDRLVDDEFQIPPAIYNTGGWDLDTPMFDTKLGAALVFIDEFLNVASLRICHVPKQDGPEIPPGSTPYQVHVATADGTLNNDLAIALNDCVKSCGSAWALFATEAEKAYRAKQAYTMAQLTKNDAKDRKSGRVL